MLTWRLLAGNVEILFQGATEWLRLAVLSRAQYPRVQGYVLTFPRDAFLVGPVQIRFQAVSSQMDVPAWCSRHASSLGHDVHGMVN